MILNISIMRILQNSRAGLNKVSKELYTKFKEQEILESVDVVKYKKELRTIRKQLQIVEDELI